jgi:molybdate transport system substrate-binding protein
MKKYRSLFLVLILVGLLVACGISNQQQRPMTLTVSAAANLNVVFPEIGKLWEQETGNRVVFNLGSTARLAQQIEQGAAVDLFAAANKMAIEDLDRKGLIMSETKIVYGLGTIGLWQRQDSAIAIKELKDLLKPEIKRIAIANPISAPYGVAAREALQSSGIWESLQPKMILGENITQTQQYVETGNVDIAIVALSNTINKSGKWIPIDGKLHQPLEQMLAIPKNAPHPEAAKQFANFINGEKGRNLMRKYGFVLPLKTKKEAVARSATSSFLVFDKIIR